MHTCDSLAYFLNYIKLPQKQRDLTWICCVLWVPVLAFTPHDYSPRQHPSFHPHSQHIQIVTSVSLFLTFHVSISSFISISFSPVFEWVPFFSFSELTLQAVSLTPSPSAPPGAQLIISSLFGISAP